MGNTYPHTLQRWTMAGSLAAAMLGLVPAGASATPESATANLVYTSLEPCRLLDTRSSLEGALSKDEVRGLDVVGSADLTTQGGKAYSGCGIPEFDRGGPRAQAIALQISVVDSMGNGSLSIWGADRKKPEIPTLTFESGAKGTTLSTVVPLRQDSQGQDLQISATESADVVVDIVGFYSALRSDDSLSTQLARDGKHGTSKAGGASGATRDETIVGNLFVTGNLGVGTTAPGGQLEVSGLTSGTGVPKLVFRNQALAVGFASAVQFGAGGAGPLSSANVPSDILAFVSAVSPLKGGVAFRTNRGGSVVEAMRVEENGRMGIGTTAPAAPLHVRAATSPATIRLESTNNAANPVLEIQDSSAGQALSAAINFITSAGGTPGQIAYQMPGGPMTFRTNNTLRAAISSGGGFSAGDSTPNVGQTYHSFGTGSPDSGDISNSGDLYITNDIEVDGTIYGETDVRQSLGGDGLVKAAAHIDGDSTPTVSRSFNNLPGLATITVTHLGTGTYEVDFGADIRNRYYQGNAGNAVSGASVGFISITPRSGNVEALFVTTTNTAGAAADTIDFYIIVY